MSIKSWKREKLQEIDFLSVDTVGDYGWQIRYGFAV